MRVFANYTVSEGDVELLVKDIENHGDLTFNEWDRDTQMYGELSLNEWDTEVISYDWDADALIEEWDVDSPMQNDKYRGNKRDIYFNDWKEFETNLDELLIHCREWDV